LPQSIIAIEGFSSRILDRHRHSCIAIILLVLGKQ
jgi:hypothetical protein